MQTHDYYNEDVVQVLSDRDRYFIKINFRTIIGLESNRRVRNPCDPGSMSDLMLFCQMMRKEW